MTTASLSVNLGDCTNTLSNSTYYNHLIDMQTRINNSVVNLDNSMSYVKLVFDDPICDYEKNSHTIGFVKIESQLDSSFCTPQAIDFGIGQMIRIDSAAQDNGLHVSLSRSMRLYCDGGSAMLQEDTSSDDIADRILTAIAKQYDWDVDEIRSQNCSLVKQVEIIKQHLDEVFVSLATTPFNKAVC